MSRWGVTWCWIETSPSIADTDGVGIECCWIPHQGGGGRNWDLIRGWVTWPWRSGPFWPWLAHLCSSWPVLNVFFGHSNFPFLICVTCLGVWMMNDGWNVWIYFKLSRDWVQIGWVWWISEMWCAVCCVDILMIIDGGLWWIRWDLVISPYQSPASASLHISVWFHLLCFLGNLLASHSPE